MRSTLVSLSLTLSLAACLVAGCGAPEPASPVDGAIGGDGGRSDGGVDPRDGGRDPVDAGRDRDGGRGGGAGVDGGPEPCDSPGTSETVACGSCGTTDRFCTAGRTWAYGACTGEGECAAGATRMSSCGNCGTRVDRCTAECTWDVSGACGSEGECAPGEMGRSSIGCAMGETRDVTCSAACTFEPAGACVADTCPTPGATEAIPCGTMCGTITRFCSAARVWSYGACVEAGMCVPGTSEPVACGRCGTRMARCTTACTWDSSGTCTGEGACTPGETSRTDAGCPMGQSRALTCNASCTYDAGACEIDECAPGAMMTVACGMCGTRVRSCSASRRWVDGPCTGEGACMPGTTGTQACGLCGTQATRCTTACAWEPSTMCAGEMACPRPAPVCMGSTLRTYVGAPSCSAGMCSYATSDVMCPSGCAAGMCTGRATLLRGLGGAAGFGTGTLPVSDDGSSAAIAITTPFPGGLNFYGVTHTALYLNNNGNLSFTAALTTYTPTFPRTGVPIIAPFFGDVDTRADGRPAQNNVHWFVDATRVVATWHEVGYYNMHVDRQNSFQVILTQPAGAAPGDFDVELRYESCEWTTGDASGGMMGLGGTPAAAGFDSGTGSAGASLALPGSGTAAVLNLCTTSNVGAPGIWRYRFRGGLPM